MHYPGAGGEAGAKLTFELHPPAAGGGGQAKGGGAAKGEAQGEVVLSIAAYPAGVGTRGAEPGPALRRGFWAEIELAERAGCCVPRKKHEARRAEWARAKAELDSAYARLQGAATDEAAAELAKEIRTILSQPSARKIDGAVPPPSLKI